MFDSEQSEAKIILFLQWCIFFCLWILFYVGVISWSLHKLLSSSELYLIGISFDIFFRFLNSFLTKKLRKLFMKFRKKTGKIVYISILDVFIRANKSISFLNLTIFSRSIYKDLPICLLYSSIQWFTMCAFSNQSMDLLHLIRYW